MNLFKSFVLNPFLAFIGDKRLKYLRRLEQSLAEDYETLKSRQFSDLKKILRHSYDNIPFYKNWFDLHSVNIDEIHSFSDFSNMVPVLTKNDIIKGYEHFTNLRNGEQSFVSRSTGGSTGQTLRYRMSVEDHQMGLALLLRGMGYGGYKFGDKLLILAGGSLVSETASFKSRLVNTIFNYYKVSSYGLEEKDFVGIVSLIKKKKIKYLRGYASSIFMFAEYCRKNNINLHLSAVFSTSERLLDTQRHIIESAFKCRVYDQYSLNDGGVSAFEYNDDKGYLVDMERSYLEIENDESIETDNSSGRILATSLLNFEFPFIRYDTGDIGEISYEFINEFPQRPRLVRLLGRETEYLLINNKKIASPVLTVLMGKTNAEQYRIIQKDKNYLRIEIKKGEGYSLKDEEYIKRSFFEKCGEFRLVIEYVEGFNNTNKHKFILREWKE